MNAFSRTPRRTFLKHATVAVSAGAVIKALHVVNAGAAQARTPKDEAVAKLLSELEQVGRKFLSVPRKDGEFLHLLVKTARARNVLEIGTSHGYSAIWTSLALEETGGRMTTIEIEEERVQLARKHVERAGLSHRVTFKHGDAHAIVPTLDGPFDFVFLDADKEGQMDYFSKLHPKKIVPGGLLVVHNAIRQRDAMKNFFDMLAKHPDYDSVTLSLTMEDGFSVSYRHRA